MAAAGANPRHIPVPLSAAWRGCVSLGHLDSAKYCSAARDGETAPRTPATEQGEEGLRKPHVGPSAHSCAAALASPPPPAHAAPAPGRAGGAKAPGLGRPQGRAQGAASGCCWALLWGAAARSCCAPQLGGPRRAPRNFLPISAHHILFSPRRVCILGCVSPILPHRQPRCVRRRVWGQAAPGKTLPGGWTPHAEPARALILLSRSPAHCPCSLCPEPGREHTSTATASLPSGSRLAHSPCTTPGPRCGRASTSLAMSTHTEHCAGARSAARQAPRLLSAPFTVLRRSRARCCSASAASRAQGWPEEVSQHHAAPRSHPRSHPQTAAAHTGSQPSTASPTQQALGFPAQILV